jgi:hypothetical protein
MNPSDMDEIKQKRFHEFYVEYGMKAASVIQAKDEEIQLLRRQLADSEKGLANYINNSEKEIQRLRKCLSKVAGLDCYHYDKILDPELCGDCISCKAREALSPQPMGDGKENKIIEAGWPYPKSPVAESKESK